jgi:hypothetical protein
MMTRRGTFADSAGQPFDGDGLGSFHGWSIAMLIPSTRAAAGLGHPVAGGAPSSRGGPALRKFNLKIRPPRSSMRRRRGQGTELAKDESPQPVAMPARAASRLEARNRQLAAVLACVAAAVFVTVVLLAVMFHYAEAHHLLDTL